jgi:hypothetical protein
LSSASSASKEASFFHARIDIRDLKTGDTDDDDDGGVGVGVDVDGDGDADSNSTSETNATTTTTTTTTTTRTKKASSEDAAAAAARLLRRSIRGRAFVPDAFKGDVSPGECCFCVVLCCDFCHIFRRVAR